MIAKERSFIFIANDEYYDIPFFQRAYVWDEDNWDELLENFFDKTDNHFLGSIILKRLDVPTGEKPRNLVIDGQQRLTTLSILVRACYDRMVERKEKYEEGILDKLTNTLNSFLFLSPDAFSTEKEIKIVHSHLDSTAYSDVVEGRMVNIQNLAKDEDSSDSQIIKCYKYFRKYLSEKTDDEVQDLWRLLTAQGNPLIVVINLDSNEDEQKIFDTVNTAGVRLSSSDTIKNALYQKLIELMRKDGSSDRKKDYDEKAAKIYENTWQNAFEFDEECKNYWSILRRSGRLTIDNLEMFLYAYAVINGFFVPSENNRSQLSQKYKEYISAMDYTQLINFINGILSYSKVYRKYFDNYDKDSRFSFEDSISRLLHICHCLEISTFYPYILKELYQLDNGDNVDNNSLKEHLLQLERYIVLNAICDGTTKNYNNECVQLVDSRKTPFELQNGTAAINRFSFEDGLKKMRNNKLPTVLLFWIELFDRSKEYSDIKYLNYTYSLEHVMPQKWQEHWSIKELPVFDESLNVVSDERDARDTRAKAIYYIGNMTLLNAKLNSSLSNNNFHTKVHGDGDKNKRSMSELADLYMTREIIKEKSWDEKNIYLRTKALQEKIIEIWNIEFPSDVENENMDGDELLDYFYNLISGKTLLEIDAIINRLNTSDDFKMKLYELTIYELLFGNSNWEYPTPLKTYFGRDNIEGLKRINNHTFSAIADVLLTCIEGDEDACEECVKEMIENGSTIVYNEEEFNRAFLYPLKNAFNGFYAKLSLLFNETNCEPFVKDLCGILDEIYWGTNDNENAKLELLEPLNEKYPNNQIANILAGQIYYERKDWGNSISHYSKINSRYFPNIKILSDIYFDTAYAASRLFNHDLAIEYYKKTLDLNPDYEYALNNMGYEYYLLDDYDNAEKYFKQCLDENKAISYASNNYAKVLVKQGRIDEVEEFAKNSPKKLRKETLLMIENAKKQLGKE